MKLALGLYRTLLRLLPPAFRDRFADEMEESFARGLVARSSRTARLRYVAAAFRDLCRTAAGEWRRALRPPRPFATRALHWTPRRSPMDAVRRDLRDAVRSLRRRPAFAGAVVVTLALGVGANVAVFALVDAVLLRPLPIARADRVVGIFATTRDRTERQAYDLGSGLSYSTFRTLERGAPALDAVAGFIDVEIAVDGPGGVLQLTAGAVSGRYFSVLGLPPTLGRLIAPADDEARAPVVVLSEALWSRVFERDPHVTGRTVRLGGTPFTVVGVAPAGFRGTRLPSRPQLWVPITTITSLRAGGIWIGRLGQRMLGDHPLGWVITIGRLSEDVSVPQASAALQGLAGNITVRPITDAATLGDRRALVTFVAMLAAVVVLTLLIACMNVANLVRVRAVERTRELAVRRALGAGRLRLAWTLFGENLILASAGCVGAILVGIVTARLLTAFVLPGGIAIDDTMIRLDATMIGVAAGLAGLAAVLIGAGPAGRASTPESPLLFRSRGAGSRRSPQRLLVAGQVALTIVLLVGALLFVRSLRAGMETDLGFDPEPLSAVSIDLFRYGYTPARAATFYDEAMARMTAVPGVEHVALASHVPLATIRPLQVDTPDRPGVMTSAGLVTIGADYFRAMGIPLMAGRPFDASDRAGARRTAILNESAAAALFPGISPIGREVRIFGELPAAVVGVVRDAKVESVRDVGVPVVYGYWRQDVPTGGVSIIARSARPAATLTSLRETLRDLDPSVAVYDARRATDQVDRALMTQRFGTLLLGLFAALALVVAALGIYSIVAFTVSQRTSELGIRIALGARRADILGVVLGRSGTAVAAGAVAGLGLAVPATRLLERFLYGIEPLDLASFGAAAALLAAAALVAMVMPARRAVRTDPLVALRDE
jgi:predicted permease